ncbi:MULTISPECIES: leucine-rich repeat domain-containing protein [unclassified Dysgonomonas]|uniref:leucine-rich repeat domain-containing protein n=1 Tax=unclassified Dysgonomonas TaxID=2630389 RepID=UPI0025C0D5E9|nr:MULTISPECIES: leucine-rich repeat domain-containing protein [unclassified Dysgonomonas]
MKKKDMVIIYILVFSLIVGLVLSLSTRAGSKKSVGNFKIYNDSHKGTSFASLEKCNDKTLEIVEIPDEVTGIGANCFSNFNNLNIVKFNNQLRIIGDNSFSGCVRLEYIETPNSLLKINRESFKGCIGLKKIVLGERVNTIGYFAFNECPNIETIELKSFTPPDGDETSFDGIVKQSAILIVPVNTKSLYASSPMWNQFKYIHEAVFL